MDRQCEFSNVTKAYLEAFRCILEDMIRGMAEAELSNSISHNFIAQMIPHHCAAVEMSQNILKYTTNIQVQEIALQIVAEQTRSIENMRSIQCACGRSCNSRQDICMYQRRINQIMQRMFSEMSGAGAVNNINVNFLREMIPHHRGAIEMAQTALRCNICPELRPILRAIITSQQRGVAEMQQLLQCMAK